MLVYSFTVVSSAFIQVLMTAMLSLFLRMYRFPHLIPTYISTSAKHRALTAPRYYAQAVDTCSLTWIKRRIFRHGLVHVVTVL